ncbi:MAG: hypothetical protein NC238_16130 [Dehalobacter sp.]|nr:hypothetical protein [Dehalobacter sp.]
MWTKIQGLVILFSIWIFITLIAMALLGNLDPTMFFILCLLGFLIIFDITGPYTVRPKWKSRVWILTAVGIGIFVVIAAQKMIELILPRFL